MHPASWRWQIRTWTLDYRCSATVENISNQRGKADHVINYAQVRQNPTHGQQCREFVVVTTMAATPCTNPWMVFSKLHRGWSCCFEINFEFREVAVPHFCCVCQVNIFFVNCSAKFAWEDPESSNIGHFEREPNDFVAQQFWNMSNKSGNIIAILDEQPVGCSIGGSSC